MKGGVIRGNPDPASAGDPHTPDGEAPARGEATTPKGEGREARGAVRCGLLFMTWRGVGEQTGDVSRDQK